jgi:hypothetical protein
MSYGPANKSGESKLSRVSQLEREIEEYLGLRRSLQQSSIPHEIRSIAENRFKVLETNIKSGSIPHYQRFIHDCEQNKNKWPENQDLYNESISEYREHIANMERARRVLAGAEH